MYKSLNIILLLLFYNWTSLLANQSNLVMESTDATLMLVKVDGYTINHIPQTGIRVLNLWPGNHTVEFKLIDSNAGETIKNSSTIYLDPLFESSYLLYHLSANSNYLSLASKVSLLQTAIIPGTVNSFGSANIYNPPVILSAQPSSYNYFSPTLPQYDMIVKNRPEYISKPSFDICQNILSAGLRDSLIQDIKRHSMDSDKYRTAKLGLTANGLRVQDVRAILNEFNWDDTKLNFIRTTYIYICDKKNFYHLKSQFKHEETERELEDYISAANLTR